MTAFCLKCFKSYHKASYFLYMVEIRDAKIESKAELISTFRAFYLSSAKEVRYCAS